MIINCGSRRLVSYRYGWKIERERIHQESKARTWIEDSPAWPSTLASGLQIVAERILTDGPDLDVRDLAKACQETAHKVREYAAVARASV